MIKIIRSLVGPVTVVTLMGATSFAAPVSLDKSHNKIGFKVKHLVISTINGEFDKFEGTADYDEKTGTLENLKVTVDPASINTNEPKRDAHLKSKDFFEVDKYPTITFVSKKTIYEDKKPVGINGDLTIHGVTKNIDLKFAINGIVADPWGHRVAVYEGSGKIDRTDFGLVWNKTLETGGVLVGNEIQLVLEGEAILPNK